MTLGERHRELRQKAGLTQKGFADAVGISQPTVGQLETGVAANPPPIAAVADKT